VLAVTSGQRTPTAPEYPTIAETVSGFDVFTFFAVAAGTPDEIVARIEKAAVGLGNDPSVREHLAAIAAEAVGSTSVDVT
jgi:tripartite-type tricarboxylate transporter receptor subunit TctC